MKNIYALPTKDSSKIGYIYEDQSYHLFTNGENPHNIQDNLAQPIHLYITSEEDFEGYNHVINFIGKLESVPNSKSGYKVAMTTNPELIKNGVQEIPEEFLRWFVNEAGCEVVDLRITKDSENHLELADGSVEMCTVYDIIMQEDTLDDEYLLLKSGKGRDEADAIDEFCTNCENEPCCCRVMFNSHTQEASMKYLSSIADGRRTTGYADEDFRAGANWQETRMYGEEDLKKVWQFVESRALNHLDDDLPQLGNFENWFQQFKDGQAH